jgi:hypothetical protein
VARQLRARLTGPEARPGRALAADVAQLILGIQRSVATAAAYHIGRTPGLAGRKGSSVETATRLLFWRIESGSLVAVLELPDTDSGQPALDLEDRRLGEMAVDTTLSVVEGTVTQAGDVPASLLALADTLRIGDRYEAVHLELDDSTEPRYAVLDGHRRAMLRENVHKQQRSLGEQSVVGLLFEADFEANTALLRAPDGHQVRVQFPAGLADSIQGALRQQAQFDGLITYDTRTSQATRVDLRAIVTADQLLLGIERSAFWDERSVDKLAAEQGVGPVVDARVLCDENPAGDDVDRFLAALESL